MRVMADTNLYIAALLFPASLPAKVLLHIADKYELVLCDHIVAEIRDVVARKCRICWPMLTCFWPNSRMKWLLRQKNLAS